MTCQKVGVAGYVVACVIYNRLSAPFPESGQSKAALKPLAKNKKLQWKDSGLKSISINYCKL